MLSNQDNNTQMPGSMPGAMPGSIPESNNTTHNNNNTLNQDAKPSIGGPHKIQSGILHHGLPVDNNTDNVHNNTHGEHNFSKDKSLVNNAASGMAGHQSGDMNPLHSSNHNEHKIGDHHQEKPFGFENHRAGNNHEGLNNNNPLQSEAGLGHSATGNPLHSGSNNLSKDNDHHYKRDAALGAAGAGLAGHELKDHQDKPFGFENHRAGNNPINQSDLGHNNHEGINNNNSLQSEAGLGQSTGTPLHPTSKGNDHHYKRDAALGAGAAGLAGHELKNHHDKQSGLEGAHSSAGNPLHSGSGIEGSHHTSGNPLHSGSGIDNHHSTSGNPLHSGSDNINRSLDGNNDHHYKRDAALGAGAAGLAGHELKNHHDQQSGLNNNHSATGNPLQSGLGHNNHEGISSNPLHSETGLGHSSTGNPLHSGSNNLSNDNDHHYKRDAALGAGAAGLAGHELKSHHDKQSGLEGAHSSTGNPLHSGSGLDNHHSTPNNPLHSGSDNVNRSIDGNNDHHYKRDAALGAGAAGIAGHELKNHYDDKQSGLEGVRSSTGNPLHSGSGLEGSHHTSGNPLHPGSDNINRSIDGNNDHHYKRDAALGAGAAGLAGHELKNHHDKQSGLEGAHHASGNPLHSGSGLEGSHHTSGNPLHHGSDNINRSIDGNNDHHYKRDAALGAGAAGLAGHELKNHHDKQSGLEGAHSSTGNPLHSGSGLEGSHHTAGNPLHPGSDNINRSVDGNNDHHYKRDAALGAGAAGLAGHELKNHHDKESGLEGAHHASGNPLHHGSDNINRSIDGNNDHHYKRDAALGAGAAGLAGHELKNHHDKQSGLEGAHSSTGNPLHSGSGLEGSHHTSGNPLHHGSDNINRSIDGNNDHHYKRDAALGAGAAGIAGHEMKNHHDKESGLDHHHHTASSGNPLHPGSDATSRSSVDSNDHHYKRDAAIGAGGAGLAGAALHEKKKHDDNSEKEASSNRTSVSSASSGEKKGAAVHDKPLNTGGDAHHVAEQPPMGLGGLTGKQPVGEINFHKLS